MSWPSISLCNYHVIGFDCCEIIDTWISRDVCSPRLATLWIWCRDRIIIGSLKVETRFDCRIRLKFNLLQISQPIPIGVNKASIPVRHNCIVSGFCWPCIPLCDHRIICFDCCEIIDTWIPCHVWPTSLATLGIRCRYRTVIGSLKIEACFNSQIRLKLKFFEIGNAVLISIDEARITFRQNCIVRALGRPRISFRNYRIISFDGCEIEVSRTSSHIQSAYLATLGIWGSNGIIVGPLKIEGCFNSQIRLKLEFFEIGNTVLISIDEARITFRQNCIVRALGRPRISFRNYRIISFDGCEIEVSRTSSHIQSAYLATLGIWGSNGIIVGPLKIEGCFNSQIRLKLEFFEIGNTVLISIDEARISLLSNSVKGIERWSSISLNNYRVIGCNTRQIVITWIIRDAIRTWLKCFCHRGVISTLEIKRGLSRRVRRQFNFF